MTPIFGLLCLMTVAQPSLPTDAAQEQVNAAKEELQKFQGTWKIEAQDDDGKEQTRAYSIASASNKNRFDLCVNRVEGGFFSNRLADLPLRECLLPEFVDLNHGVH